MSEVDIKPWEYYADLMRKAAKARMTHLMMNYPQLRDKGWTIGMIRTLYTRTLAGAEEKAKDLVARKMLDAL